MKQRITASIVILLCCVTVFAGNLLADDVSLKPGETKNLTLSLTSAVSDMVGVQFYMKLPKGFSLTTIDGAVCQLSQNQASDIECNVSNIGSDAYRFLLYSKSLNKLNAGELMSINLKAGNNLALGNYELSINEVAFSDADGLVTKEEGMTATIKLTHFYPTAANIEMPDMKIISGETAPLTLKLLESITGCVGIQFDLSLPDGFSLEKDATGKEYTISTSQASDVTCNITSVDNGAYRFIIYSNSLKEFVSSELMNINLKVYEEKPFDTYHVSIQNVLLSDIAGNVHKNNEASANVTVTKFYTLVYKVDDVEYKSYDVEYGAAITPEAEPTKEGYTFSGWSEIPETMPAHNVTVSGTFTINKYKLTYKVDDVEYKSYDVECGSTITPEPEPTKEGYTFSGWSEIPETMPAHDVTVSGTFSINSYILTYIVDGVEYKSYEINYGTSITAEIEPAKVGHTFSGWSEIPETMPAHDVTVTGSFSVNSYTLTYMVDGEVYKTYEIEYGTTIIPEETPTKIGYTFSGWGDIPSTMPAKDVTLSGTFSINSYKLTYVIDGEEYKTVEIEYNSAITPEAEPTKEGHTFSGWSEIPETMPAYDVTVTGSFTVNTYTLTYMVDGEVYKTSKVNYGTTITPEAAPTKTGYTFSGWDDVPLTMPARDVTISGTFAINSYKLTYIVDGEEYKTFEIIYNSAITPEAEPTKEGHTFSGWSEIPKTMPAYDVTVTGLFIVNKYQVTYIIDGEVFATDYVEYGATIVPPTVEEREGFTFSGWDDIPETMPAHDIVVHASYTSGIIGVLMASQQNVRIYSPNGKKLEKLQKGLNIIVLDDGTVKKVVVK